MSHIRLIPANLNLEYQLDDDNNKLFYKEFTSITQNEEDSLGAWLKRAKARGETKDSDQVLLTLLVELHRKFDDLNSTIKNEKKHRIKLDTNADIVGIGFDGIGISEPKFKKDSVYYGRIDMPIFPRRTIALYLKALDEKTALIANMHSDDESDWNAYVTARERVMIRQKK